MATKKITELTTVTSVAETDKLILETSSGTRAVAKSSIISSSEKSTWNAKVSTSQLNTAISNAKAKTATVALSASSWTDNGDETFSQTVTISGGTATHKVIIDASNTVILQLINDGVASLRIDNDNGTFIAVAIKAVPTADLSIQVTLMEVA